jgi:hypothetical protein
MKSSFTYSDLVITTYLMDSPFFGAAQTTGFFASAEHNVVLRESGSMLAPVEVSVFRAVIAVRKPFHIHTYAV